MKNLIKILIFPLLLLTVWSCDEEGKDYLEAELRTAPEFFAGQGGLVSLNPETPNSDALTLNWSQADYGQNVEVNYIVYLSPTTDFTNAEVIANTTNNTASWVTSTLNSYALNFGMSPDVEQSMYLKVESSIGDPRTMIATSETLEIIVVPYNTYNFKDYYLVGNAISAGWNTNNNNPPLFRDATNSNLYRYTGKFVKAVAGSFDEGRWKIFEIFGSWQPQWGVTAAEGSDDFETSGAIAGNPATQANDPGRFGVETEGYYTFTVDFASLTYNIAPYDASGATTYPSIGFIGSATPTGWDSDTDMTNISTDPHIWYASNVTLSTGELKFRANDGWDNAWGGETYYSGVASMDGGAPNIPVFGGVYNIWFNDLTGDYIMIPVEE